MSDPSTSAQRNPALLAIYCNDHLAASVGGIELVKRMIAVHADLRYEARLRDLLGELREENDALTAQMTAVGLPVRRYKQVGLWVGEKLSRLKLNGHWLSRSPLSSLVEFEFLASAVRAKRSGFETLRALAVVDTRLDSVLLDRLIAQADRQHDWLTQARREVAAGVFGGDPAAADEAAD